MPVPVPLKVLYRKKVFVEGIEESGFFERVLSGFDLVALGVGSTLGVGVYVLAGVVARETAGPAVVVSFLIAAIVSMFAGLCYAEFGCRVPRAGSAYVYTYVCVGECAAFVIGWDLILEYSIGSASVARGFSEYLDNLVDHRMAKAFRVISPMNSYWLSGYFDFFSASMCLVLTMALAFGLRESSFLNIIFTCVNVSVVLLVVIAGSFKADVANWTLKPPKNVTHAGAGGFFPFGLDGMFQGAATCFYAFVGFDAIATTGEEVKNPKKVIPIAIILSLLIVFLAYFGISTILTLMVPYYDQDRTAAVPEAFAAVGWVTVKWIVSIGGIFGLCASLFGAMFPLPRIVFAMASDGVLFRVLGKVHPRFKTNILGTALPGILVCVMAGLFEIGHLVNLMSIGTLMSYAIVSASVLLLRYEVNDPDTAEPYPHEHIARAIFKQIFNIGPNRIKEPTYLSARLVVVEVFILSINSLSVGACFIFLWDYMAKKSICSISVTVICVLLMIVNLISITTQPMSKKELSFKVPFVPLVPALSVFFNICLMLKLDFVTWIRFLIWLTLGLSIYGFYGIPNSIRAYKKEREEKTTT